jgi:hypothetical protein
VENLSESEEKALMKGLNNLIDYFMTNYNNWKGGLKWL